MKLTSGPMAQKQFEFNSHDAILFGRHCDCHAQIPDDPCVSRHHFILETNPPHIRIRDLGSLNGTLVNGKKLGGRCEQDPQPNKGHRREFPHLDLYHGDVISVGETEIRITVLEDRRCRKCGSVLPMNHSPRAEEGDRCGNCSTIQYCAGTSRKNEIDRDHKRNASWPILADYDIEKELGRGGMGAVFLAYPKTGERKPVAVKVMLSQIAVEEKARDRFVREVELCRGLRHPRIVSLLNHGVAGSIFFIVMEYCSGGDLEAILGKNRAGLPIAKAKRLMKVCLEAMECAHHQNLVHRDLKPANILLDRDSKGKFHPKISDFGLAKSFQLAGLSGMTATGTFGGSWHYMPREQLTNFKFVQPASDVWSLGAIFYRLLTGRRVRTFSRHRDPVEVILEQDAIPIRKRNPNIPRPLAEIVDRALATEPSDRFRDAGEFRMALNELD